jgi:hypothetical protein
MRNGSLIGLGAGLCLAGAVALTSPGCGPSALQKAYTKYDSAAQNLLDPEINLWKRLQTAFNEQLKEQTADPAKFEQLIDHEVVAFYDAFATNVKALTPGDPGLAAAHDAFVRYATCRMEFAHYIQQNLDVFSPAASTSELSRKSDAAGAAATDYQAAVSGPTDVIDSRFTELAGLEKVFREDVMKPFAEGKMAEDDVQTMVRTRILPKVKELRSGAFSDDQPGKLLARAISTAEEFYTAMADNLPLISRNTRFGAEVGRRIKECDAQYDKFIAEMKAARRK